MDISKENLFSFQGMGANTGGGTGVGSGLAEGGTNFTAGGGIKGGRTGGGKFAGKFSFIAGSSKFGTGSGNELTGGSITFKKELSKAAQSRSIDDLKGLDFAHHAKLDSVKIDKNDAQFFLGLLEKNGIVSDTASFSTNQNGSVEVHKSEKSANVSKTLLDLLEKANDTKRPIRLDFDNNITLVLRVNADGKINAQFFPGDKAAEEYLRNNIPYLRQQFEQKEIPYSKLSYQNGQQGQGKQKEKQDE